MSKQKAAAESAATGETGSGTPNETGSETPAATQPTEPAGYQKGAFNNPDPIWMDAEVYGIIGGKLAHKTGSVKLSTTPTTDEVDDFDRACAMVRDGDDDALTTIRAQFIARYVSEVDRATFSDFPDTGDIRKRVFDYFKDEHKWAAAFSQGLRGFGAPRVYFRGSV